MAADSTAYDAVLKEIWTSDNLEEQIYQDNPLLEQIEKTTRYNVGDKAVTPLHTGRSGGYSVVPRTGSTALNVADNQKLTQAQWNYTHHWFQVKIETATVDETSSKSLAAANVVDSEVDGAVSDLRKQITRQAFSNGDALIAQAEAGGASTTVELDPTGFGNDAIVRGWLYPGLLVDVGTTASEASLAGDSAITAVTESVTDPKITISNSITTTSAHFVSVANARSGTTSFEMNGLRNIVDTTSTLGTVAPATFTNWKSSVDSTSQALSLGVIYAQQRAVMQRTGKVPNWVITSLKQQENFYKLLQVQARFDGDQKLGAGNVGGANFAGMKIDAQPDCPDRAWYLLSRDHLFIVATDKPHWHNKYTGSSKILDWAQGTTQLVAGLVYRIQLATDRRNAHAALTALT